MSARYHILISDELMASGMRWPKGMKPVEREPTDPDRYPGSHWWLIRDRDADPSLEFKRVDPTFRVVYENKRPWYWPFKARPRERVLVTSREAW